MKIAMFLSLVVVLVFTGLLGAASCGSSATTPTTGNQVKPTDTATPAGTDYKPAAVTVKDFAYSPATLTVAIGTAVTWTNQDSIAHTVTSRAGVFDSGRMDKGGTFSYTFANAGDYEYYCTYHTSMIGHITVK